MTFRRRVPKPKSPASSIDLNDTTKPSQADQAHIATAEYWREQNAGNKRMASSGRRGLHRKRLERRSLSAR